ncbi:MAG: RIP metalloprotease RseP [bacterium]
MFLTIITFLIVLSVLVLAHEFGHFMMARKFGVRAEEFGLGFPPRAFGVQIWRERRLKKISESENVEVEINSAPLSDGSEIIQETIIDEKLEVDEAVWVRKFRFIRGSREINENEHKFGTVYSLNWLPLGGFVKIKGENGEGKTEPDSFAGKKIWQRAFMLSAGVVMNIVLAAVLISAGFMIGLPQSLDGQLNSHAKVSDKKIQIVEVMEKTPAELAGLKVGDAIVSIDNNSFSNYQELQNYVASNVGNKISYKINRGQDLIEAGITPKLMIETNRGGIGVAITETGTVRYPWYLAIFEGFKMTLLLTWAIIVAFYELIKNLIFGHGVTADLSGPVGIATLTGQVARMGFVYLLQFTALLSINLAVINFFPFPALDGGRILFLIIEKIKRSPVKSEVEGVIHNIGFALLMLLVLLVTFRDVAKFDYVFKSIFEKIF